MAIPFLAVEISGLANQTYASGSVNRGLIDAISGNLDTRIDALAGAAEITWNELSAGDGIATFEGVMRASGQSPVTLDVLGYSTISSQAKIAYSEIFASGTEYTTAYNWYTTSSQKLSTFASSGNEYTSAFDWYTTSAQKLSHFHTSANEYTSAYLSAQALQNGAFRRVATGWASVADNDTIAHTLGVKPLYVSLTPSGAITYATAFTTDATNITVRLSCAGSRVLNWRAEL